jgi:hypothetical protein
MNDYMLANNLNVVEPKLPPAPAPEEKKKKRLTVGEGENKSEEKKVTDKPAEAENKPSAEVKAAPSPESSAKH